MIEKKQKKPKQKALSTLTTIADNSMSLYIRMKWADENGYCECVSCGSKHHWKDMDCGHFISRRYFSTRFVEENAHPECRYCNRFNIDHHIGYTLSIIDLYGKEKIDELKLLSKTLLKPSEKRNIVEEAITYYQEGIKRL